jgi:hypothetical protein
MVFRSARAAGLPVPDEALDDAGTWFESATDATTHRTGLHGPGDAPADGLETMTAFALASRLFRGADGSDPIVRHQADLLGLRLPREEPEHRDASYAYHATLAIYNVGGDDWKNWSKTLGSSIRDSQRTDGHALGSWDPTGNGEGHLGRVATTALNALSLEIYYRYARAFR